MSKISIVTGNPGKVRELRAMAMGKLDFIMADVDLTEIQSLDLAEIVTDKLKRAYAQVGGPVIVDDVSAGLESLQGLPGPFIKFFDQKLGGDALWKLAQGAEQEVTIRCMAGYYDGSHLLLSEGVIEGTVVAPRGTNGFGFDAVIMPEGQGKTMAEMSDTEKSNISHRGKAFRALIEQVADIL